MDKQNLLSLVGLVESADDGLIRKLELIDRAAFVKINVDEFFMHLGHSF